MKNSTIVMMTAAVVAAIVLLLAINLSPMFSVPAKQTYIFLNSVQGSAVVYQKKPYTLNFEQQNAVIDILNRAVLVKKSDYPHPKSDMGFDNLVIYPFSGSPIEIQPIAYSDKNMIYSAPAWNKEFYFMELSAGSLQEIIRSAHD